jgi:hypothetical protein
MFCSFSVLIQYDQIHSKLRAETMLAMTAEGHILLSCEPLIEPSWGDEGMGGGLVGRWWLAGGGGRGGVPTFNQPLLR